MELTGEEPDPANGELLAELLADLHEEELDASLEALVGELAEQHPRLFEGELDDAAEAAMRQHLAPLARAAELLVDRAAEATAGLDPATAEEAEVLGAIDAVEARGATPAFEQFLDGLKKKLKKVAGKAISLAKKGVALMPANLLLKPLLAKLKPLIRPLLDKVIKVALDKVPEPYRPMVAQLARKLRMKATDVAAQLTRSAGLAPGSSATAPPDGTGAAPEPAAPDVGQAQQELDLQLAEMMLADDRTQDELIGGGEAPISVVARDPIGELDVARDRFIRAVTELDDPEAAGPVVEQFIPAVLLAVRTGIKLLGRPKVVGVLGDLIGNFVAPLVGKASAPALGRVLADVGLRTVLQAEVKDGEAREAAGAAVAATVEDTVRRVAAFPEALLDQPEMFEALAYEAFQAAAAANFPSALVKPELREAGEQSGAWVFLPRSGRKLYKKYSRVFDARISPALAHHVRGFGGETLGSFLRDRLRLDPAASVAARVHVYESIPRTRLSRIALHERARGLGSADPGAWRQLHPLTTEAAALLLGAPRLGRETDEEVEGDVPYVGQRLYFLEIPAAPARPLGQGSHAHVSIDMPRKEIRVCLYLSEVLAQRLATGLRRKSAPATLVAELRAGLAGQVAALASHRPHRRIQLRLGRAGAADRGLAGGLQRRIAATALDWTWAHLARSLDGLSGDLISATDGPEDGVRLQLVFQAPEGLAAVQRALRGKAPEPVAWPPAGMPHVRVEVRSGPKHD